MNEALKVLAYSGGEWVIHLLIVCSVITIAVIVDRLMVQLRERKFADAIMGKMRDLLLDAKDIEGAKRLALGADGAAARILAAGLKNAASGVLSAEEHMAAVRSAEKRRLELRLLILGTLGNNAPFIGLFGTVLGVIKAFHDLSASASAGPEVVMQGLSEALVATAVGLLVAIPAVMAYNYFQKRVNDLLTSTDELGRLLVARLKEK